MNAQHRKSRSPSAPSMTLQVAIEKAAAVETSYKKAVVGRESIANAMGYTETSGKGMRAIASLQAYGLLKRAGKGECCITELAMAILHPQSDDEKIEAIRTAVEKPKVFSDLLDKFGYATPNEHGVATALRRKDFGEVSAKQTAKFFVSSMAWMKEQGVCERFGDSGSGAENMEVLSDSDGETIIYPDQEKPMIKHAPEPRFTDAHRSSVGGPAGIVEFRLLTTATPTHAVVDKIIASLESWRKLLQNDLKEFKSPELLPASNE